MTPDLEAAVVAERVLREELAVLITQKQRDERDAERLQRRGQLPGADPRVVASASALRARAAALGAEIEERRRALRAQEGVVAELRVTAPAAGAERG